MVTRYFAHTLPGKPPAEWQPLEVHLTNVADSARRFAESFGAGDWGYAAGLLHDIGKFSREYQDMLLKSQDNETNSEFLRGPDHSSAGAQEIHVRFPDGLGKLLAYAIAGHHSGLLDGKSNDACLQKRLLKELPDYHACPDSILRSIPNLRLPLYLKEKAARTSVAFRIQLFIRMIFSCLVDADRLDTELFSDTTRSALRGPHISLEVLRERVRQEIRALQEKARGNAISHTMVNRKRSEVLQQCLRASEDPPGIFSLTVPTGGGKTLSSLAFALEHAVRYSKERVIYVIPYTCIIEQNAAVFRKACGDQSVLEHHSNFEFREDTYWAQLASENWDCPLIITTNVQFFETLFHSRTSRCRRAHNIANSVVIFDEAQMLPGDFLIPCMALIQELARSYGVTAVLCSATQPALGKNEEFKNGIEGIREIIADPQELYSSLRRVTIHRLPLVEDRDLAARLEEHKQVLCIVNTRRHARQLYNAVAREHGLYHLSGLMCPAHRAIVLDRIRNALGNDAPCRVVSTQLIEAGVDIDFPVVFRAISGIDSVAQAAGRCNREGKLTDGGSVFVFLSEDAPPPGYLRQSAEETKSIIRNYEDILSLGAIREYFKNMYWRQGDKLDRADILGTLAEGIGLSDFPFRTIAEIFHIIEEGTQTIIIPFNERARALIREMTAADSRRVARELQPFSVQVYPNVIARLGRVALEPIHDRYYVLINDDLYRPDIGLDWDDPYFRSIERNIL
jgi:CRISPR-associated endonuclease/helicase Cas3